MVSFSCYSEEDKIILFWFAKLKENKVVFRYQKQIILSKNTENISHLKTKQIKLGHYGHLPWTLTDLLLTRCLCLLCICAPYQWLMLIHSLFMYILLIKQSLTYDNKKKRKDSNKWNNTLHQTDAGQGCYMVTPPGFLLW